MKVYFNSPPPTNLEHTFSSHRRRSSHHAPPSHQHSQLFDVIKATPSSSFSHTQRAPIHIKSMHDTQHPTSGNQQFRLPNPWRLTTRSRQMIGWSELAYFTITKIGNDQFSMCKDDCCCCCCCLKITEPSAIHFNYLLTATTSAMIYHGKKFSEDEW